MLNLYITSTIKKEGKTFLASGIAATMQSLGYKTAVYKPIQTSGIDIKGFTQSPDLTFIKSIDPYINTEFSYVFKSDVVPLIAAEIENQYIDLDLIQKDYQRVSGVSECTILDGDNGILTPIAPEQQTLDIVKRLQLPLLFVVTPRKDAINDTLLSVQAAYEKGVDVRGIVINSIKEDCPKTLLTSITRVVEEYSNAKILGLLPYIGEEFAPEDLITSVLNGVDIESIFGVRIEKLEFSS